MSRTDMNNYVEDISRRSVVIIYGEDRSHIKKIIISRNRAKTMKVFYKGDHRLATITSCEFEDLDEESSLLENLIQYELKKGEKI